MRKFFGYLVLVLFIFSIFSFCEAAPAKKKKKAPPIKHKIEFTTRDRFILVGDLYFATKESNKPLIVCLHSYSANAQVWKDFAQNMRQKDYNVLAMDLRGHGRSIYNENLKLKSRFYYKNSDWQRLPKDMIDSIKYVKANYPKINTNEVIVLGADIGASVGAIASTQMPNVPKKLIFISPMLEFKGLDMPVRTTKFQDSKIFMILSKTDRILMNFYTKNPPIVKHYPIGGPGYQLIRVNKDAYDDVIKFIIN